MASYAADLLRSAMMYLQLAARECESLEVWGRGVSDDDRADARQVIRDAVAIVGTIRDVESRMNAVVVRVGRQSGE